MQEYWELYMKSLEGKPASIQFNAGISMELDDLQFSHPTVGFVKAKLKEPNKNGFLSEKEEPEILFMEDKLESSMIKFRIGKYVGRIISDGYVTFLYYLQFSYNWPDFVEYAMNEHTSYEVTNGHSQDSEWNYYKNLLYPTAQEWQLIQNHKVCDSLKEQGDSLQVPRAIEHKVYFENEESEKGLREALEKDGFKVKEEIKNEDGVKGLNFYRIDKPFYHDIDQITLSLIEVTEFYNAQYDGWETSVVKSVMKQGL
jgi:regulator of RNase E activity RraB